MATLTLREEVPVRSRILVVDDHPVLREGLVHLINQEPDLLVCGVAENIPQMWQVLSASCPDLVLTDLTLGNSSGLDLIKDLHVRAPRLPMLVLSMHDELLYAGRVLRSGARGYVMKREKPEVLLGAIRKVLRGEIAVSGHVTSQLLLGYAKGQAGAAEHALTPLSDRELDVLTLIGQGCTTSQIAHMLRLSPKTVWTHRAHIMKKLQLQNPTELVRYATHWVENLSVS
jgi:DNA-binding NarL/FixJ family response regulator